MFWKIDYGSQVTISVIFSIEIQVYLDIITIAVLFRNWLSTFGNLCMNNENEKELFGKFRPQICSDKKIREIQR